MKIPVYVKPEGIRKKLIFCLYTRIRERYHSDPMGTLRKVKIFITSFFNLVIDNLGPQPRVALGGAKIILCILIS